MGFFGKMYRTPFFPILDFRYSMLDAVEAYLVVCIRSP